MRAKVSALEHAVNGVPVLRTSTAGFDSAASRGRPTPSSRRGGRHRRPGRWQTIGNREISHDRRARLRLLAGSLIGVRVPCARLSPPTRRRVTVRRTVGYGRLDRVDRRHRRHLACARVVVVRRHDAHRGRPGRTIGNPDRDDTGLVRPGRSRHPLVCRRGPGHPRRHCRRDGGGHSRGVSGRCARTGALACEPRAAFPHGRLGRRDLCADSDLAVDAVIYRWRELRADPPPGLVDRARLCVAHRRRGAQPSRSADGANGWAHPDGPHLSGGGRGHRRGASRHRQQVVAGAAHAVRHRRRAGRRAAGGRRGIRLDRYRAGGSGADSACGLHRLRRHRSPGRGQHALGPGRHG